MANQETEDLVVIAPSAGVMFRAEMTLKNLLMGHWKAMLAVTSVALLAVLVFGQYQDYHRGEQRKISSQIADIERTLTGVNPLTLQGDEGKLAELRTAGADLAAIGEASSGSVRIEAYLKAAEWYRLAKATAEQKEVLQAAEGAGPAGAIAYAIQIRLANLELEEGAGDAAVQRLQALSGGLSDGALAEQAAVELATTHEYLGHTDQALSGYQDFLTRWPDSPRAEEVQALKQQIESGS